MRKQVVILSAVLILIFAGGIGGYQYVTQLQQMLEMTKESNIQLIETLKENSDLMLEYKSLAETTDDSYEQILEELQNRLHQKEENYKALLASEASILAEHNLDMSPYVHIYSYDDNITSFEPQYYLNNDFITDKINDVDRIEGLSECENEAFGELSVVLQVVSEHYFDFLPIKIVKMETTDDGIIATVNLSEMTDIDQYPRYYGWKNGFFQGSSGGMYTEDTLLYNILQPDKADWPIDGVIFTYEDTPITEFEHVMGLMERTMRSALLTLDQ